jgi:hypothetical protein
MHQAFIQEAKLFPILVVLLTPIAIHLQDRCRGVHRVNSGPLGRKGLKQGFLHEWAIAVNSGHLDENTGDIQISI